MFTQSNLECSTATRANHVITKTPFVVKCKKFLHQDIANKDECESEIKSLFQLEGYPYLSCTSPAKNVSVMIISLNRGMLTWTARLKIPFWGYSFTRLVR